MTSSSLARAQQNVCPTSPSYSNGIMSPAYLSTQKVCVWGLPSWISERIVHCPVPEEKKINSQVSNTLLHGLTTQLLPSILTASYHGHPSKSAQSADSKYDTYPGDIPGICEKQQNIDRYCFFICTFTTRRAANDTVGATLHQVVNDTTQSLGFFVMKLPLIQSCHRTFSRELFDIFQNVRHA